MQPKKNVSDSTAILSTIRDVLQIKLPPTKPKPCQAPTRWGRSQQGEWLELGMSGEAVLIPVVYESLVGIAGAVNAAIETRRELARQRAEAERERIQAWRNFQTEQATTQEHVQRSREAVRRTHEQLIQLGVQSTRTRSTSGPAAQGFVQGTQQEAENTVLRQILEELEALPNQLFTNEQLPFARLRQHLERMRHSEWTEMELESARRALHDSLQAYLRDLDNASTQQRVRNNQAQELLTDILQAQTLSMSEAHTRDLTNLQEQLLGKLHEGVTPASLDVLRNRFDTINAGVERTLAEDEMSDFLVERVTHHLQMMGYTPTKAFTAKGQRIRRDAEFALPDGDRLQIALQPDLRMAFQLSHEAHTVVEKTLSGDALSFFRQQEARWCRDMKELIKRLMKDGVPYEVQFEREIPESAIPLVVYETAEDLLEDEEDQSAQRSRDPRKERQFE